MYVCKDNFHFLQPSLFHQSFPNTVVSKHKIFTSSELVFIHVLFRTLYYDRRLSTPLCKNYRVNQNCKLIKSNFHVLVLTLKQYFLPLSALISNSNLPLLFFPVVKLELGPMSTWPWIWNWNPKSFQYLYCQTPLYMYVHSVYNESTSTDRVECF